MASTDLRPRSQSVTMVQTRPPNQSRAGRIFQRVSDIKGRLQVFGRKPKDDRDMNPYPVQAHSMDGYRESGVKPYMSHAALDMHTMVVQPLRHRYRDGEDSSISASPNHSPSRSESRVPTEAVELPQPQPDSPQCLPRNSIPAALIPGLRTGAAPSSRSIDGLTYVPGSQSQPLLGSRRPTSSAGGSEVTIKTRRTPEIVISDSLEPAPRPQTVTRPSTSSGQTSSGRSNTTSPTDRILVRSHSQTRLKQLPRPSSSHPPKTLVQTPGPSTVSLLPPSVQPTTTTNASSPAFPQPGRQIKSLPPTPPSRPSTTTHSSPLHTQPTAQPRHQPAAPNNDLSPNPRLRTPAPKLSLPVVNRLSLTMPDGYSARFSPSIMTRTPPLPMMSLPPLPAIPSEPSSSSIRQGRVGLRNLPELPHRGIERGNDGDGEDDMEDDMDEEDEGQEREQENDTETLRDSSSIYHDFESSDELSVRPVESGAGVGLRPALSLLYPREVLSGLPEVKTSGFNMDFSFLNRPLSSSPGDPKGKGRARSPVLDDERTPTSSSMRHDYFSDRGVKGERESDEDGDEDGDGARSERPQRQAEGSSHARIENGVSPARTPRGGSTPALMASSAIATFASTPASGSTSTRPIAQDSLAPLSHRLSRLDLNSGLHRPTIYKHASRSMIDIHAMEKKEMVEEMVRGAEEEASLEEKVRRRQSVIATSAGRKGKGIDAIVTGDHNPGPGGRELPLPAPAVLVHGTDEEGTKSKRISKAPAYEAGPHPLRRRRSMPSFIAITDPPPYPAFERRANAYGIPAQQYIQPRDDEGRERLPGYSNDIYLKSIVPRKMEFVNAGVQAKDRKWRRVVCVLEGTALKVYRCPANIAGVSALEGWWEKKVGVGDVSVIGGPAPGNAAASGSGSSSGIVAPWVGPREGAREGDRVAKGGDGNGQTDLHVSTSSPAFTSPPLQRPAPPTSSTSSRSRLGLGNLLKPGHAHARSTSDIQPPSPRPRSPRASLNIPVGATGSNASSRSHSPIAPSSASSLSASSHSASPAPTSSSSRSHFRGRNIQRDGSTRSDLTHDPNPADLIRAYTMQHAESGLGNDYIKRRNVIRVRVEGEQFLFQAKDVADVVTWIEGLQAAANIALDLDERPMPKGPLFPRRRRRRGARPGTEPDTTPSAGP